MNTNEKKLNELKIQLEKIYRQFPEQFAVSNAKSHLKKCILEIEQTQAKRNKRKLNDIQNQKTMQFASYENAKAALEILDQMLEDQQKQLDKQNQVKQNTNPQDELFMG